MVNETGQIKNLTLDFADHDAAVRVFDEAFLHPSIEYVVNPSEICEGTGKRMCFPFQCPIAYPLDAAGIRELDPGLYASDYAGEDDDYATDWMALAHRPRYAYVPNVIVIGCEDVLESIRKG